MNFIDEVKMLAVDCGGYYGFLASLIRWFSCESVLELGTGTGGSGAAMMEALSPTGKLVTVNWPNPPSGDDVGVLLDPWRHDSRLLQILGDTREVREKAVAIGGDFDLLFIDSGTDHNYELIAEEWRLYESALADGAVVCCDDLDFPGGGIRRFWDALPYEKVELPLSPYGFGVFLYRRGS